MKMLLVASVLALSSAAAADKVGAYVLGLQYQQDSGLRFGVGLPAISLFNGNGTISLAGDVSYLIPIRNSGSTVVSPYYGFGLGLGIGISTSGSSSAGGVSLYPNVLAGLDLNTNSKWTPFLEGSVGPTIGFARVSSGGSSASGVGVGFGFGLRVGVNYDLR